MKMICKQIKAGTCPELFNLASNLSLEKAMIMAVLQLLKPKMKLIPISVSWRGRLVWWRSLLKAVENLLFYCLQVAAASSSWAVFLGGGAASFTSPLFIGMKLVISETSCNITFSNWSIHLFFCLCFLRLINLVISVSLFYWTIWCLDRSCFQIEPSLHFELL